MTRGRVWLLAGLLPGVLWAAPLKIADATGDGCDLLKLAAVMAADQLPDGVEILRLAPEAARENVRSGKIDLALTFDDDSKDLVKEQFGSEALGIYVNFLNSVGNAPLDKLREICSASRPEWSKIGGATRDIHRFYPTPGRPGFGLAEHFLGHLAITGAVGLNSSDEGILLAQSDPEAMVICRWQSEYPADQVKALAVNVVPPTTETIRSGEYPLSCQYVWLYREKTSQIEIFSGGDGCPGS